MACWSFPVLQETVAPNVTTTTTDLRYCIMMERAAAFMIEGAEMVVPDIFLTTTSLPDFLNCHGRS
jgi:hypothetical protein